MSAKAAAVIERMAPSPSLTDRAGVHGACRYQTIAPTLLPMIAATTKAKSRAPEPMARMITSTSKAVTTKVPATIRKPVTRIKTPLRRTVRLVFFARRLALLERTRSTLARAAQAGGPSPALHLRLNQEGFVEGLPYYHRKHLWPDCLGPSRANHRRVSAPGRRSLVLSGRAWSWPCCRSSERLGVASALALNSQMT